LESKTIPFARLALIEKYLVFIFEMIGGFMKVNHNYPIKEDFFNVRSSSHTNLSL